MPKTPAKKRSTSQAASPQLPGALAATKKINIERAKRKRRYQFAPVNNLGETSVKGPPVLRSISVSQVRNTSKTAPAVAAHKEDKAHALEPAVLLPKGPKGFLGTNTKDRISSKKIEPVYTRDHLGPSQEVVWKYSPTRGETSDKLHSSLHNSPNDTPTKYAENNDSSTPIVPNRLKKIINFSNMSDHDMDANSHVQPEGTKAAAKNLHTKQGDLLNDSFRDIDAILDDIEGHLPKHSSLKKLTDMPSSPMKDEITIEKLPKPNEQATHNSPAVEDSKPEEDEEDDSLIEMLTQQYASVAEKKSSTITIEKQIDVLDIDKNEQESLNDSLIEYLEDSDTSVERLAGTKPISVKDEQMASYVELAKSSHQRNGVQRLVIISIQELQLPKIGRQKILSCVNCEADTVSVIVRHPWVYLEFEKGDVVHIIEGQNIENKRLLSDDKNPKTQLVNDNLLILNPDILLSATSVGGSIECLRRAVLQTMLQDTRGEASLVMTKGNIVHELLQKALALKVGRDNITKSELEEHLLELLQEFKFAIIVCNKTVEEVKAEILAEQFDNVLNFVNKFVRKSNYGCYVSISGMRKTQPISVSDVIDIEENIWSHVYGLKGFLDAHIKAHIENDDHIAPLEIKTGKMKSISHEAQGLIYTLLLKDRYELPVDCFFLLYTRYNDFTKFPQVLHSVKHVLMFRNQMSVSLKHQLSEISSAEEIGSKLPPLLQNSFCDSCYMKTECMVINRLQEGGTSENSGLNPGEYEVLTEHLIPNIEGYKRFFKLYNDLITKEESTVCKMNQELFLIDSKTRESLSGHCIANLSISEFNSSQKDIGVYLYQFRRVHAESSSSSSFLSSKLAIGDRIIVSDENGHFCLCQGHIVAISRSSVTISTKRKLLNNKLPAQFHMKGVRAIRSVVNANVDGGMNVASQNNVTYRLDKNDIQHSLSLARYNLLNLFLPPADTESLVVDETSGNSRYMKRSEGGDALMRNFLVDNKLPRFISLDKPPLIDYDPDSLSTFNEDQLAAVAKICRAKDYALILGMPGTGKTTVIAELIKILASHGKSILLASYTHSAVDNILLKLENVSISIMRLGSRHRVHPQAQKYVPCYDDIDTYEQYRSRINSTSVVATTCLGLGDIMFSMRDHDFDYVILDEASQISMPVALGPLRYGSKFIMVGDHYQLPPLVRNESARVGGLEISPFQLLCERQPQSVVSLTYQYRMCADIAALSNFLIYENRLKCGTSQVAQQKLQLPNLNKIDEYFTHARNSKGWLSQVLNPEQRVVFLDHDKCPNLTDKNERDVIVNEGEVELTKLCVEGLIRAGLPCSKIGLMTLYKGQLRLLHSAFQDSALYPGLEILTVDQFQGRDKECIIISMVRSNPSLNGGVLMKEQRRLNVAMTRARSKLIILGSKKTIGAVAEISSFVDFLHDKKWIYSLDGACMDAYHFPTRDTTHIPSPKNAHDGGSANTSRPLGGKTIREDSSFVKNKPITRQALTEL